MALKPKHTVTHLLGTDIVYRLQKGFIAGRHNTRKTGESYFQTNKKKLNVCVNMCVIYSPFSLILSIQGHDEDGDENRTGDVPVQSNTRGSCSLRTCTGIPSHTHAHTVPCPWLAAKPCWFWGMAAIFTRRKLLLPLHHLLSDSPAAQTETDRPTGSAAAPAHTQHPCVKCIA